jgi:uncharacterized protein YcbX
MGDIAAQWFSDFLGRKLRLVRFDPDHRRPSSPRWTRGVEALNQFSDAFPLLVTSSASLELLNEKLRASGHAAVGMERFRPNIVLGGVEAHDEDRLAQIDVATDEGAVQLRPVKPCARCPIPNIDPASAEIDTSVTDTLQGYRSNGPVEGGITFGMNAIIVQGLDRTLRVGQAVAARWDFPPLG